MITYDYECKKCGTQYEVDQKLTDDKLTENECPKCNSITPCKRIITKMNFKLLGGGWADMSYCNNVEICDKLM